MMNTKISYGLLQYQLEKLHAVVGELTPLHGGEEVSQFSSYLEQVIQEAGYTPDEHAQLFFDDESPTAFGPGSFDLTDGRVWLC